MEISEIQNDIFWNNFKINKEDRVKLNGHKSCLLWFTGLSGSGKSTLANELEKVLFEHNVHSYILDGDNIRHGLNKDLGFNREDRKENIRRVGEVAKLFVDSGIITIGTFISPFLEDRFLVRSMFNIDEFIEVYIKCSIKECERRDTKGLYKRARQNLIENFTGITSPYEPPLEASIVVDTERLTIQEGVDHIFNYLLYNKIL